MNSFNLKMKDRRQCMYIYIRCSFSWCYSKTRELCNATENHRKLILDIFRDSSFLTSYLHINNILTMKTLVKLQVPVKFHATGILSYSYVQQVTNTCVFFRMPQDLREITCLRLWWIPPPAVILTSITSLLVSPQTTIEKQCSLAL